MGFLPAGDHSTPQPCSLRSAGRQAAPTRTTALPKKPAKKARTSPTALPEQAVKNMRDSRMASAAALRFRVLWNRTDRATTNHEGAVNSWLASMFHQGRPFGISARLVITPGHDCSFCTSHLSHIHDRSPHQSFSHISYRNLHYLFVRRSVRFKIQRVQAIRWTTSTELVAIDVTMEERQAAARRSPQILSDGHCAMYSLPIFHRVGRAMKELSVVTSPGPSCAVVAAACCLQTFPRSTELKQRLQLWEAGEIHELVGKILGQQHSGPPSRRKRTKQSQTARPGPLSSLKTRNGSPFGSLFCRNGPSGRSGRSKFRRGSQISSPFLGLSSLFGEVKNGKV